MKSKILMILHIPPPINGAAIVGKYISESERINNAFSVDYINLTTSFELGNIGKGSGAKLLTIAKILSNTAVALVKNKYELCYMTLTAKGAGFYKDFLVVVLLKLFRKKIFYHFHNKGIKENSNTSLKRWLYRITLRNTKSILLAPELYDDLATYVGKEDVYFCPNGIPDLGGRIKHVSGHKIPGLPCKFLFLSNMMREKGVFVLLDACSLLQQKGIPFECHFVGAWSDVSEEDFKGKVAENNLYTLVHAHGPQYGDSKLRFFGDSDVFVFPTFYHNEAFPLVNLEAMQQSLPIISTLEGGIPTMISDGETGFLVPQRNVLELAEKMALLIGDPELRIKMGLAGRRLYEERFTLPRFEDNMMAILQDAIGRQS